LAKYALLACSLPPPSWMPPTHIHTNQHSANTNQHSANTKQHSATAKYKLGLNPDAHTHTYTHTHTHQAATWDKELIHRVAVATHVEIRAQHNEDMRNGVVAYHHGLNCWSPVINIMRHWAWGKCMVELALLLALTHTRWSPCRAKSKPLTQQFAVPAPPTHPLHAHNSNPNPDPGRNDETYGECPVLSATFARQFVSGLQGNDTRHVHANPNPNPNPNPARAC
jgi:hypothetical protein